MLSQDFVRLLLESKRENLPNGCEEFQYEHSVNKSIDRLKNISYETFFSNYLDANKPCIISLTDVECWQSSLEWVANKKPNFEYLKQNFGRYSSILYVLNFLFPFI